MKVLLVTNVPTHYRMPLYEELQRRVDLDVVFYSDGQEWYWRQTSAPPTQSLRSARTLHGFWVGRTRLVPSLVPLVLTTDADVVVKDPNGKFALPVTYLAARLRRKPFVFWASLWEHPTTPVHRLTRPLMRYLYRHADAIVTYGRHVTRFVVAEGADPSRVVESPQSVPPRFAPPPSVDRWSAPRHLLYVGRLERWKGVDLLLDALRSVPGNWTLDVVGDGAERSALEEHARPLGGRVTFVGGVPNDELADRYQRAAAVVIPSRRTAQVSETWSLVVNEAMQAGALVVASDAVGAARDGLVSPSTGLVVPEGSVTALAAVLTRLVNDDDPSPYVALARAGQEAVREYSYERAAAAFVTAAEMALS
jgi:glycosyltransferase involved in cell wall biosynthesis